MSALETSRIGSTRASPSGRAFTSHEARTGAPIAAPVLHAATPGDVASAGDLAWQAFLAWRRGDASGRAAFLRRVADMLDAQVTEFVAITCRETALPEARIRGETARTSGQLRMFATAIEGGAWRDERREKADPDRKPAPRPSLLSRRVPLGPVAVFGASNFPMAFSTAGGDTASAWAAGCPVVVKAHPAHPLTALITADLILRAAAETGQPDGIFSLLLDDRHEVGTALVRHPRIAAVGFTGSRSGGLALSRLAAERPRPIPVFAEMSSVNPVVVLPEALANSGAAIAAGLHASYTLGSGQFCTCPGLVLGDWTGHGGEFEAKLVELTAATPSLPMLTPGITGAYRAGIERLRAHPAVRVIAEGQPATPGHAQAIVFHATLDALLRDEALAGEVFGPCTLLVDVPRYDALSAFFDRLEGQLTVSVHGTPADLEQAGRWGLLDAMERICGRLVFNGFPTGVEVNPAIVHGGPFPATSDGRSSSVGTLAMDRFLRPFCWQGL